MGGAGGEPIHEFRAQGDAPPTFFEGMDLLAVAIVRCHLAGNDLAIALHVAFVLDDFEVPLAGMLYFIDKSQRPVMRVTVDVHETSTRVWCCAWRVAYFDRPGTRHLKPDTRNLFDIIFCHHLVDKTALINFF